MRVFLGLGSSSINGVLTGSGGDFTSIRAASSPERDPFGSLPLMPDCSASVHGGGETE
jgi:hypothetical protein